LLICFIGFFSISERNAGLFVRTVNFSTKVFQASPHAALHLIGQGWYTRIALQKPPAQKAQIQATVELN